MGGHEHVDDEIATPVRRAVQVTVAALGLLTLVGLIVLWPSEDVPTTPTGAFTAGELVESEPCDPPADDCVHIVVEVAEGPDAGTQIETDYLISSTSPP